MATETIEQDVARFAEQDVRRALDTAVRIVRTLSYSEHRQGVMEVAQMLLWQENVTYIVKALNRIGDNTDGLRFGCADASGADPCGSR